MEGGRGTSKGVGRGGNSKGEEGGGGGGELEYFGDK